LAEDAAGGRCTRMTTGRFSPQDDIAAKEREAIAWLVRITDDGATEADRAALERWLAASPANAQAFATARELWKTMPSAIATAVKSGDVSLPVPVDERTPSIGRRGLMIGFGAAAAAAAAYVVIDPPLGLWPSLRELAADYRTATGQQRRITIATAISVEMNTQTSIALRSPTDAFYAFELIAGEAIVGAAKGGDRPVQVVAANGVTTATDAANFDVRCDASAASITCLSGVVRVQYHDRSVNLSEKQQVSYGGSEMSAVRTIDPAVVTAWQAGYLMFRNEPLVNVIDEVNRYRPGRIVLLDRKLGQNLVTARFKLDRLNDVIVQVREVFGAPVRTLPGGVVLVG
jgi:transmembrane sensor